MKRIVGILSLVLLTLPSFARDFKDCTELKDQCFTLHHSPEKSFQFKSKETKTAILVHGLSDSAYFTKDIAMLLYSQGYNVYSVLLTGHGTSYDLMINVKAEDWIHDIKTTIEQARKETGAEKVLLAGFSLGGALVTTFAEDKFWKDQITKLILIAPAFQVKKNKMASLMCNAGAYNRHAWDRPEVSPVKYNKMFLGPVCELLKVAENAKDNIQLVEAPVFMAVTDGDKTINTKVALETFNKISSKKELFYVQDKTVTHTDLLFKLDILTNRKNPQFDEMASQIVQFLK